jgi:hypothetical protein
VKILRIYARVSLRPAGEVEELIAKHRHHLSTRASSRWHAAIQSSDNLDLLVTLTAEDVSGRQIESDGWCFGIGGPREESAAVDIEDDINYMLGRDAALGRPPEPSWGALRSALARAKIDASMDELVTVPLTVEFDAAVVAALRRA